jgi:hypothetical protein
MQRKQKIEKQFDTVATMRQIRTELSKELEGKSFEEVQQYLRRHVPSHSEKRPQPASSGGARSRAVFTWWVSR